MKRGMLAVVLLLLLVASAHAQYLLRTSPTYSGANTTLVLYVSQWDQYNITLNANTPIQFSVPVISGAIFFRLSICENALGGFTPSFTATSTGGSAPAVVANFASLASTAPNTCSIEWWTYRQNENKLVLEVTTPTGSLIYTGPVQITANSNNGTDFITNLCVNGECPASAFGASGSANGYNCSITAGASQLICQGTSDFQVGQWVLIPGAGQTSPISASPSLTEKAIGGFLKGTGFVIGYVIYAPGTNFTQNLIPTTGYPQANAGDMAVKLSSGASCSSGNVTVNYTYNSSVTVSGEVVGACDGTKVWFYHPLACGGGAGVTCGTQGYTIAPGSVTVAAGSVTATDNTGLITYQHKCAYVDALGGMGPASALPTGATTTGLSYPQAFVEATDSNPVPSAAAGMACWGTTNGGSTYTAQGLIPSDVSPMEWLDVGNPPVTTGSTGGPSPDIPASPPGAATNDHLIAQITAISGSAYTLSLPAFNTAANVTVYHDDLPALENWINSAGAGGSHPNRLTISAGTYFMDSDLLIASAYNTGSPNDMTILGPTESPGFSGAVFERISGDPGLPVARFLGVSYSTFEHLTFHAAQKAEWAVQLDAMNAGSAPGPDWTANRPTAMNTVIYPVGGNLFVQTAQNCTNSGSEPSFAVGVGATVSDNNGLCLWKNIGAPNHSGISEKTQWNYDVFYGGMGINSAAFILGRLGTIVSTDQIADVSFDHSYFQGIGGVGIGDTRWAWHTLEAGNAKDFSFYFPIFSSVISAVDTGAVGAITIIRPTTGNIRGDLLYGSNGASGECLYRLNGPIAGLIINSEDESGGINSATNAGSVYECGGSGNNPSKITLLNNSYQSNLHPSGLVINSGQNLVLQGNDFGFNTQNCPIVRVVQPYGQFDVAVSSEGNLYGECNHTGSVFQNSSNLTYGPDVKLGANYLAAGVALTSSNDYTQDMYNGSNLYLMPSMNFTAANMFAGNIISSWINTKAVTLATLPACSSALEGTIARATTCSGSITAGATCDGLGAVHASVACNGANWVEMGF